MSERRFIVLGAGLVGRTIARGLAEHGAVTCADRDPRALAGLRDDRRIATATTDVSDRTALQRVLDGGDLVVSAMPGHLGHRTLATVIAAGHHCVDISFFPEDPFSLDDQARRMNVTAVVDCGVAPGLCNLIAGHHDARAPLVRYECLVGGLPLVRRKPWEYQAVFSPADVIEEYTRPARLVEQGRVVVREALSGTEPAEFDGVGTLEAFNTDGLRTLLRTMPHVPEMKEKTLRYPGHAELMRTLRTAGLFSKEPMDVDGTTVVPLHLATKLLASQWAMQPGDEDLTVMRVTVEDARERHVYQLLDRMDTATGTTSMARTTGHTCIAAALLVADGRHRRPGITAPEQLGADATCFNAVIAHLRGQGIDLQCTTTRKDLRS